MLQELRRLIELAWSRLAALLQAAPPGSLQLTGVLGLAALIAGYFHLRGDHGDAGRPGTSNRSSSRAANDLHGQQQLAFDRSQQQQQQQPDQQRRQQQQQQQQQQAAPVAKRASPSTAPTSPAPRGRAAGTPLVAAVRNQLQGMKRVTLSAPGVLLEQWEPADLRDAATARQDAVEVLKEMTKLVDVYLIAHVPDDVGAAIVAGALEAAGVVGSGASQVAPQRLLLCSTPDGKVAIVRQLEPDLHIDASVRTVGDLSRFVPQLLLIARPGAGAGASAAAAAANVETSPSLASFFGPVGGRS